MEVNMKKKTFNYDKPFDISFNLRGLGSTQMDGEPFVTTAEIFRDGVIGYLDQQVAKGTIKSYTISVSVDNIKEKNKDH